MEVSRSRPCRPESSRSAHQTRCGSGGCRQRPDPDASGHRRYVQESYLERAQPCDRRPDLHRIVDRTTSGRHSDDGIRPRRSAVQHSGHLRQSRQGGSDTVVCDERLCVASDRYHDPNHMGIRVSAHLLQLERLQEDRAVRLYATASGSAFGLHLVGRVDARGFRPVRRSRLSHCLAAFR